MCALASTAIVVGLGISSSTSAVIQQIYTLPFSVQSNVTCEFHCYYDPTYGWHEGVDYDVGNNAAAGDLILAATSGTAKNCGFDVRAGYYLVIDHGNGHRTRYLHLNSQALPGTGQPLGRGHLIGYEGSTGVSSGPHLHFETRHDATTFTCGKDGTAVDPYGVVTPGTYLWTSNPPILTPNGWQPVGAYQSYGSPWASTDLARGAVSDFSQAKHSVLVRVNSNGYVQYRLSQGGVTWDNWATIWGLSGVNGPVAVSNHRNGSQDQIHVAAVKNGDVWYTSKIGTGSWSTWASLGHYGSATATGSLAISNSDIRVWVAYTSGGNVYLQLKYSTSWGGWWSFGGGNSLTGSIAIVTRPNGMYNIAALRFDGHVLMTCSANYAVWNPGWTDVGWVFGGALAIDNDAEPAGSCGSSSFPGVVLVGFSANDAYVWCWEAYCPQPYEWIGGCVGGPAAISNAVNPYSGNIRWLVTLVKHCWDIPEYGRYKVY